MEQFEKEPARDLNNPTKQWFAGHNIGNEFIDDLDLAASESVRDFRFEFTRDFVEKMAGTPVSYGWLRALETYLV